MQRSEISSNTECLSELKRIRVYGSYRTSIILEDLKLSRKNFRRQRRHLKTPWNFVIYWWKSTRMVAGCHYKSIIKSDNWYDSIQARNINIRQNVDWIGQVYTFLEFCVCSSNTQTPQRILAIILHDRPEFRHFQNILYLRMQSAVARWPDYGKKSSVV